MDAVMALRPFAGRKERHVVEAIARGLRENLLSKDLYFCLAGAFAEPRKPPRHPMGSSICNARSR